MKFVAAKRVEGGAVAPPAPLDQMDELKALAEKIGALRLELDDYINEHARVLALGANGVPQVALRQMIDGNSRCLCAVATKVLSDKAVALELERKS
jgi:hypothetical protein